VKQYRCIFIAAALCAALTGCASIDFDYPRTPSTAVKDVDDTHFGSIVAAASASNPPGQSGFYPLQDGIDALTARLLLADRAERSIDTQYYLIKTDATSTAFIDALLRAADRGVRVRLLVDDVFTAGYDTGMAALDSHPNFEVRIFNPFRRGTFGRAWSGLTDLGRVNRRMHTKTFTVDNQVTILGGRNIADEYFGAREDAKFGDLDVVGVGEIANEVSDMFDSFWNHETALPVPAFAKMPDDPVAELEKLRERLREAHENIDQTEYADAVRATALEFMDMEQGMLDWTTYQLVYDSPDKGIKSKDGPEIAITMPLGEALQAAKENVLIVSPYFVPRKRGIEYLSDMQARGINVTIVTNSLAANNQLTVHGGYSPSRKPLLKSGVRIYEIRPDADVAGSELIASSGAKATLHTKSFLVDGKWLFIGSFNFDPRSANLNTESGVIIESEQMGSQFAKAFAESIEAQAYEVFLNEDGNVRWRGFDDGQEVIYQKEPQSTWSQRFFAGFMRFMPVRSQL
jgi:putative cardiolipin synthase